ncbi:MAG: 2-hydroxyacyl-CoA dehydratase [Clostridia bacterium]|nr:2-hydroxyacyl-CoA dehydratase [Clostridia bacterium]
MSTIQNISEKITNKLPEALADKLSVGLDIGSTTAKIAITKGGELLYARYERHFSKVRSKILEMLQAAKSVLGELPFTAALSGSAGLGLAKDAGIPFVQEVWATGQIVRTKEPDTAAVIELGGEDAKILFFKGGTDERMNGSCAGGTGAFIDQMASLLNMTPDEMDEASLRYQKIYPIASRCGVFAKSDIQPLLNQGASKEDVAASSYQAVVNQTIAGLAQGRKIEGKVLFLGGPLYFCKGLRDRFTETLHLTPGETAIFPEYARIACALGAALYAEENGKQFTLSTLCDAVEKAVTPPVTRVMDPLFTSREEYEAFAARHRKADVPKILLDNYAGDAWLGIDCGSTTTKMVLIDPDCRLLYTYYDSNKGNPVAIVKEQLERLYSLCGDRIRIMGSAVTGYGEDLIKNAFHCDTGIVETIAHYTAARHFQPEVDFILDIGGQDIKCFRIRQGTIDSIMLNEACSSGCGSFIETFARSMGYSSPDFARLGLFADAPVNLGSRCTVFMNSQVKQSQKDGATVADISAGLSVSVVKNAIYKVIRAHSPDELGKHIVVQGGTFHNDAVLRSFEREIGREVVRPSIAGLMGAYGAALYVMEQRKNDAAPSALLTAKELESFTHTSKTTTCQGCTNHCFLTINTFSDGKRFISGNKCEGGLGMKEDKSIPNLYETKRKALTACENRSDPPQNSRGKIGLPLALGMYELAPLWYGIFEDLGFTVIHSGLSSRELYEKGHFSIPSDTACYPAKIMHGHMELLIEEGCDAIFYPRLTYNIDEKRPESDNHYNCPVVAYYSELLAGNMDSLKDPKNGTKFYYPYLDINNRRNLLHGLSEMLAADYPDITKKQIRRAIEAGFVKYEAHMRSIREEGEKAVKWAREHGRRIMILAGRPYHTDPEIGHGIDKLALSLGYVVVSEDAVAHMAEEPTDLHILNQWTYHSRLYRAALYAGKCDDVDLVQLVSFGCGVDAITTDEVRQLLESRGRFYTQIKIDEISNLGAVKIRLRTLKASVEAREK